MALPNLEAINFRSEVVYGKNIDFHIFGLSIGIAVLWIGGVLFFSNLFFSIRKLS